MIAHRIAEPYVRVYTRLMLDSDALAVQAIDQASFEYPWSEHSLLRRTSRRGCNATVAELGPHVIGFYVFRYMAYGAYISRFAVHPEWRRHQVGTQLLGRLLLSKHLQRPKRKRVVVDVRENQVTAQLFFRENGFRWTETRREHFINKRPGEPINAPFEIEDAYRMEFRIDS